ncbi:MAG: YbaK/EbsC family protein [Candidatus Moranbacteria bacterium]|nr:YbaK/EbsC family protein [Candidatus Moranbacteria bacterium]
MTLSKKIAKYLGDAKYKYELVEHKTTYTAWDTSQTEKVKPQEVAKALIMKADNDYVLALIPANRNLDKQKLLKVINAQKKKNVHPVEYRGAVSRQGGIFHGVKKIDFAKEAWMKKNLLGKVGATPPFGKMMNLEIYADNLLLKNKKIYLGSGKYTLSIRVNTSQYLKIESPVKGSFSKSKK